jgi:hypothetical protein
MNISRALFALAWADLLERVRRYSFLIVLAFAVYFGYLASVGRIALAVNNMRGVYNSAWVGALLSLVGSVFLTLVGFYFVKNTIQRDRETGVGQILAATPISKFIYILGKVFSNFAVLSVVIFVLALSAIAMQLLRGEDTHIHLWTLLSPFLFLALPAMAVVAALAVALETIPFLSGGLGNVLYFFLWTAMLSVPIATRNYAVDLGGISIVQQSTKIAAHAIDNSSSFSLNAGDFDKPVGVFQWDGITWTSEILLTRLAVLGVALLLSVMASLFFNRFDSASAYPGSTAPPLPAPSTDFATGQSSPIAPVQLRLSPLVASAPRGRFLTILSAELKLMLKGQKWWWYVVAGGLLITSAAVPDPQGRGIALACTWMWSVLLWSSMGIRESLYRTDQILFSAPHPIARQLPAIWLSGVILALLTGCGFALRLLLSADLRGLFAWFIGALFIPTAALALGVWTGTGKPFEILFTLLWYVGPMHATPALDFMGSAPATAHTSYPLFYLGLTAILAIAALAGRKRQLLT